MPKGDISVEIRHGIIHLYKEGESQKWKKNSVFKAIQQMIKSYRENETPNNQLEDLVDMPGRQLCFISNNFYFVFLINSFTVTTL